VLFAGFELVVQYQTTSGGGSVAKASMATNAKQNTLTIFFIIIMI
jgi:hypothetical protein